MSCCVRKDKCQFKAHSYNIWSKAWLCKPKDNLLLKHECPKFQPKTKKKNFIRINIEAIPSFYRKQPQDAQKKATKNKMEELKFLVEEAMPAYPCYCPR
ncbi:hypothetical protein PVAND_007918 [Polypedilum vanderplanki]|uniref:Uncharacterized protein n=1 Tax=Polypedilum vanderplanki TaxID=319348 RepID=A0A9J6C859_POLVA|nr:hypothetical protein PVAND_007918 [Polypedilum vanderplanki]